MGPDSGPGRGDGSALRVGSALRPQADIRASDLPKPEGGAEWSFQANPVAVI